MAIVAGAGSQGPAMGNGKGRGYSDLRSRPLACVPPPMRAIVETLEGRVRQVRAERAWAGLPAGDGTRPPKPDRARAGGGRRRMNPVRGRILWLT